MKAKLTIADIPMLVKSLSQDMKGSSAELAKLDALIGDGDMGFTVSLIVRTLDKYFKSFRDTLTFRTLFADLAERIGEEAPSTFGTFIATMLRRVSEKIGDIHEIDAQVYSDILIWSAQAVMDRGKAKPGDKTLLDALVPAGSAAKASADAGGDLTAVALQAAQAGKAGAEMTIEMRATKGRAGYMGDRTKGSEDPGAKAISIILASIGNHISNA